MPARCGLLGGWQVIGGFAGGTADAFTLFERFEGKLDKFGNLTRAAIELAKDWRADRYLRDASRRCCWSDPGKLFVISGNGDVIEPSTTWSRSAPAARSRRAARAAREHRAARAGDRRARAEHRRRHLYLHQPQPRDRGAADMEANASPPSALTPRSPEGDRRRARQAHRRPGCRQARGRDRAAQPLAAHAGRRALRPEITPKNILMIGPTGCRQDRDRAPPGEARRAPFVKVEATKFTEVGYVGRDVDTIIKDLLVDISVKVTRDEKAMKRSRPRGMRRGTHARCAAAGKPATTDRRARRPPRDADRAAEVPQDAARGRTRRQARSSSSCSGRDGRSRSWRRRAWSRCSSSCSRCSRTSPRSAANPPRRSGTAQALLAHRRRGGKLINEEETQRARSGTPRERHRLHRRDRQGLPPERGCTAPTSRARACSATCCRWSRAPR